MLQEGDPNGKSPEKGQTVKMHYVGTLPSGMEFDRSNQPFSFKLGIGTVIKG